MHAARTPLFVALSAAALTSEKLAAAPRYKMVLSADKAEHGVSCVSFVENPAIQRGWVALAAATAPTVRATALRLSTENQEQVVTGPALVPGLEILRLDEEGNPYYISFDAATIRAAQLRFAEQGKHANTNEGHAIALSGNTVFESWIVRDPERDPATTLGYTPEQIPAGTWMLSAKVPDATTWAKVQSGELTGFSIEALFDAEELKLAATVAPKSNPMKNLWQRLSAFLKLASVKLKDGTELSIDDTSGEVVGPDGATYPDGEYELPDGTKLVVKDGKKVEPEKEGAAGSSGTTKVETADESVAAAQKLLEALTAETTPADAKAILEKALAALGVEKPAEKTEEETKLAAVALLLESVEMADGSTLSYNPISRLLSDASGVPVMSGYHACKDGSFFRVETNQYTYTIDAETYAKATTQLSAVQLKLTAAETLLGATPAGLPVTLGGDTTKVVTEKSAPTRVSIALSRVAELHARTTSQE